MASKQSHPGSHDSSPSPGGARATFETFLTHDRRAPRKGRTLTHGLSLALHGAVLGIAVLYSFWHTDELSPRAVPLLIWSPGVPPPSSLPSAPAPASASKKPRRRPSEIVQPPEPAVTRVDKLQTSTARTDADDDVPPGKEGDEPGARPGSGLGGDGKAPAPAPARFLAPSVARGQLAIDPQSDRYRVKLPPALARAGMALWAMVRLCMERDGRVTAVSIIKGADPELDPLIVATLKTWRYKPFTIDGRPVPFCTNVRYEISTR